MCRLKTGVGTSLISAEVPDSFAESLGNVDKTFYLSYGENGEVYEKSTDGTDKEYYYGATGNLLRAAVHLNAIDQELSRFAHDYASSG